MTSARAAAAARSPATSTVSPGCAMAAAIRSALAAVRFQINTWRIGRTAQWARTRCGASAPEPTMSSVAASGRASQLAASAEFAAVFQKVRAAPSIAASGIPLVPSNST
jgi:hypothetical protein